MPPVDISIIIPTYKRPAYVELALSSIQKSTGMGIEFSPTVWLIDDSEDGRVEKVAKGFTYRIPIKFLAVPRGTPVGKKRNIAVDKTHDPLLIFMDSDIELKKSCIKELMAMLREHETAAMASPKVILKKGDVLGDIDRPRPEDRRRTVGNTEYLETNFGRILATYKDAFLQVGGYDYMIFADRGEGVDLSCRYWRAGFPIVYAPKAVAYHHHDAPDSLTRVEDGNVRMLVSLLKMEAKYEISQETTPYFYEIMKSGRDFQDLGTEVREKADLAFQEWMIGHRQEFLLQKSKLPSTYAFTPQDIFTHPAEFERCIHDAKKRLSAMRDGAWDTKTSRGFSTHG